MINIKVKNFEEIKIWYCHKLLPKIQKKCTNKIITELSELLYCDNIDLSESTITDILVLSIKELRNKYSWIDKYFNIARLETEYKYFRKNIFDKHKYASERKSFILSKRYIFSELKIKIPDGFETNDAKTCELINRVSNFAKKINDTVKKIFSYDDISDDVRNELVYKLNIPICPYCNKQFIQAFKESENKFRYLGDIDHVLPKDIFPLFSLSIMNLVPSCKSCNQSFKNKKTASILNPYEEGFDNDVFLHINFLDPESLIGLNENINLKWKCTNDISEDKKIKACNNIHMFKLNETYEFHKKDIQLSLKRAYKLSKSYRKCVDDLFSEKNDMFGSVKEYFGVSLNPDKFQEELLSKAIYDALMNN